MMDFERLHAYVDGELGGAERAEVEAVMARDPAVERRVHSMREMKRAIGSTVKPVEAEDVWRTCVGRLNEIDKARRTESFVTRYAFAMCTVLFALIVGVGLFNRNSGNGSVAPGELVYGASIAPLTVPSSVNDWLKARNSSAQIPPNLIQVTQVAEGRFGGRSFLRLSLRDGKGEMALFVIPGVRAVDGVVPMDDGVHMAGQVGQDNCVVWPVGPAEVLMLAGSRDHEELRSVALAVQSASRP